MAAKKQSLVTILGRFEKRSALRLPLVGARISAGFPSPADDFIDRKLDLNELLVSHPASTFFVRVQGDSMIDAGIHSGDILIVDRSLEPADNKIIIAVVNGELTVKRIGLKGKKLWLLPENRSFKATEVTSDMQFEVWGIVTNVIHPA